MNDTTARRKLTGDWAYDSTYETRLMLARDERPPLRSPTACYALGYPLVSVPAREVGCEYARCERDGISWRTP